MYLFALYALYNFLQSNLWNRISRHIQPLSFSASFHEWSLMQKIIMKVLVYFHHDFSVALFIIGILYNYSIDVTVFESLLFCGTIYSLATASTKMPSHLYNWATLWRNQPHKTSWRTNIVHQTRFSKAPVCRHEQFVWYIYTHRYKMW